MNTSVLQPIQQTRRQHPLFLIPRLESHRPPALTKPKLFRVLLAALPKYLHMVPSLLVAFLPLTHCTWIVAAIAPHLAWLPPILQHRPTCSSNSETCECTSPVPIFDEYYRRDWHFCCLVERGSPDVEGLGGGCACMCIACRCSINGGVWLSRFELRCYSCEPSFLPPSHPASIPTQRIADTATPSPSRLS